MNISIMGGSSWRGGITIASEEFVSSARCKINKDTGEATFTCEVKETPKTVQTLRKLRKWPIPRVIYILMFFWVNSKVAPKIFLGLMALSYILPTPRTSLYVPWLVAFVILFVPFAGFLWLLKKYIATWHAAEHMAIACFDKQRSYDFARISMEAPIHQKCGGRFAFPMIIASVACLCLVAFNLTGLSMKILNLISLEIILWIDTLVGYDKIPGFSHVSVWLQKWVTTKKPGQNELRTASLAVERLVAAHHAA